MVQSSFIEGLNPVLPGDRLGVIELSNRQIDEYVRSDHVQIVDDFDAVVVRVHDGDTISLRTSFRDVDFPLRLADIDADELNAGGEFARDWLSAQILGERVRVLIDRKNRVGKFGRLIGTVIHRGVDLNEVMLSLGIVSSFGSKNEGEVRNLNYFLREVLV
jgi:endonuclease YncB( thermonuclease family)